jgi:hypothetical protein
LRTKGNDYLYRFEKVIDDKYINRYHILMASTADSSIKNIFSVPGKALKAKKIIVLSLFLIIAVVIYNSFGYLAAVLDRPDGANLISDVGFVPLQVISFNSSLTQIIFYLGVLLSIFSIMTGFMAVSIFDFEEIRFS